MRLTFMAVLISLRKVWAVICLCCVVAGCLPPAMPVPQSTPTVPAPVPSQTLPSAPAASQTPKPVIPSSTPTGMPTAALPAERAQYSLSLQFDYAQHSALVEERISYPNQTGEVLNALVLVVEANHYPGAVNITSVRLASGEDLAGKASLQDHRLDLPLPQPLPTGASLTLELSYRLQIPTIPTADGTRRPVPFGYSSRQTNLVDWYPYIAAYRPGTGWLLHEPWFYGEHQVMEAADYQVELELVNPPNGLVVAASSQPEVQGKKSIYKIQGGRSFALSASTNYEVASQEVDGVTITSYTFPWDAKAGQAALADTAEAVKLYSSLFGPYRRTQLSVIEADFLDGMEYEGLYFLSRGFYNLYDGTPKGYLTAIAVHETAHQWWYAMVGDDQAIEPWLDEGLATYSERIFYENTYPELSDWWWAFRVNFYNPVGWINHPIYDYGGFQSYRDAVYLRSALFLEDLRIRTGDEAFFAFLKDFATQFSGKIASGPDFFSVLKEHSSADISGLMKIYFDQTIASSQR